MNVRTGWWQLCEAKSGGEKSKSRGLWCKRICWPERRIRMRMGMRIAFPGIGTGIRWNFVWLLALPLYHILLFNFVYFNERLPPFAAFQPSKRQSTWQKK